MAAKVVCFASAKGGAGKTTLAASFGTLMASVGGNVLLVDADASTNGLSLLYIDELHKYVSAGDFVDNYSRGVFEWRNSASFDIVKLGERLSFIPASFTYADINVDKKLFKCIFVQNIDRLRSTYDYIFIDAQAGADDVAQIAISRSVSDLVVIVSEYDPMSAAGVERLKGLLRDDLTYERTWVLLNKILPEFANSFSSFLSIAKYLSPIVWDAGVVRAYANRALAIDTDTGNDFTLSVCQSLRSLFGTKVSDQIDNWLVDKAAMLKLPISKQYSDTERELAALLNERRKQHYRHSLSSFSGTFAVLALMAPIIYALNPFGLSDYGIFEQLLAVRFSGWLKFGMLLASLFTVVVVFIQYFQVERSKSVDQEIFSDRLDRRIDVLRDHLMHLDTLNAADPETLIRKMKNT